jgi:hypothetical protein
MPKGLGFSVGLSQDGAGGVGIGGCESGDDLGVSGGDGRHPLHLSRDPQLVSFDVMTMHRNELKIDGRGNNVFGL